MADAVLAYLFELGHAPYLTRGTLRERLGVMLREMSGNADLLELVCRELARRDGDAFGLTYSLNWQSFDYARRQLEFPRGAERYALWADKLGPGDRIARQSAEYWLARWQDHEGYDTEQVERARNMLDRLMTGHAGLEEMSW